MSVRGIEAEGAEAAGAERSFRLTPRQLLGRYSHWLVTIVNLTVFFVAWQLFARAEVVSSLFLPAPTDIFGALEQGFSDGTLPSEILWSARALRDRDGPGDPGRRPARVADGRRARWSTRS